jgi:diphosphomevalonate decarboxylase
MLDGVEVDQHALAKAQRVITALHQICRAQGRSYPQGLYIESQNSFPTGAGLASSASGLAALTVAAAAFLGLDASQGELSAIARLGSGSACRSIFGGFVLWDAGERNDGQDCSARMIYAPSHWDLRGCVAVIDGQKKALGSTQGMLHTRDTSPYYEAMNGCVDCDIADATRAIEARDLPQLGRVAERSALRMHAAMAAADPALIYLQPESWRVVQLVYQLRRRGGPVFFTADAGPNIKIFGEEQAMPDLRAALEQVPSVRQIIPFRLGDSAEVLIAADV